MATFIPEMKLFDDDGQRLYLTATERDSFLKAAGSIDRVKRMFCHVLHYTGCRPSEVLEISPARIDTNQSTIIIRTLKKKKFDNQGRKRKPQFREIPVKTELIDKLDLVFDLREKLANKAQRIKPLWTFDRSTAYRSVKKVMAAAGITGPQASPKGLRHGFAIAMLEANPPIPLNILANLLGHSTTKTTEIYLQAVGTEKRNMVLNAWK